MREPTRRPYVTTVAAAAALALVGLAAACSDDSTAGSGGTSGIAAGEGRDAAGDGRDAAGDGRDAAGDGRDAAGTDGTLTRHETSLDGLTRTWSTYTPPSVRADPAAPVLLVIHGTGDTGSGIRSGIGPDLEALADDHGFSVVYVDGHENNWNECRREGDWPAKERDLDDVGLMRAAVADLGARGPVYAVGFSSGGHMAMRLALEAPDLVDGVAVVAANPPVPDNQTCRDAGEPLPIMFVQGREDTINPYDGGEVTVGTGPFARTRGEVLSAADGARWFADRNGISVDRPEPRTRRDGGVETTTWEGPDPVRLVAVDRVGHSFPTLTGRWGGDGGARYDAPGEIWKFLSGG